MIDGMQRTARNVGKIVVVLPAVFVQRIMAVVGRGPMMLVFGRIARSEFDANPWERTKRRKYECGEGE